METSLEDLIRLAQALARESGDAAAPDVEVCRADIEARGVAVREICERLKGGERPTSGEYEQLVKAREDGERFREDILRLRSGLQREQATLEAALSRASSLRGPVTSAGGSLRVEV